MPGWVEGMNGPTGLMIGAARGVVRSMHCNPEYPADVVPVDIAINAMIISAYKRGSDDASKNIEVVNIALPREHQINWGECVDKGEHSME